MKGTVLPSLQSQAASMTGLYWVGLAWGPLLLCLLLLSSSCSASTEQPPPTQGRTPVDQGQHQGTFATAGSSKWLPMSCTLLASTICCTGHSVYLITHPPHPHSSNQIKSLFQLFPLPSLATKMPQLTAFLADCPAIFLALMSRTCWLYCFSSSL